MGLRRRVYVSGPLTLGDRETNVRQAVITGLGLIYHGYAPLIPHLTHYADPQGDIAHEVWMEVCLPWVAASHALLRLPGTSVGADAEVAEAEVRGIPVFHSLQALVDFEPTTSRYTPDPVSSSLSDPRFHKLLSVLGHLHDKKQQDYGTSEDPLYNLRGAASWGVPPWVGALVRVEDKLRRLKAFANRGRLTNEAALDSLKDLAAYALLAHILLEEEFGGEDALLRR